MRRDEIDSTLVVKMQVDDINFVLEILVENDLETWSYNDFLSEIQRPNSIVLVGKIKDKVIGFCIARLIIKLGSSTDDTDIKNTSKIVNKSNLINLSNDKTKKLIGEGNFEAECEIYNLAVKKDYQNQGFGEQILAKLVYLARGCKAQTIWLEVRNSNLKAINFYKKAQFKQVYERKNFYSNPVENALVMKMNLH